MLFSSYGLHSFLSLPQKEEMSLGQEQNHKTQPGAGKLASYLPFLLSLWWETLRVLFCLCLRPPLEKKIIFPCRV